MLSLYRFPALYGLAMRIAYRQDYGARHALIADMIGRSTNVLELCCGDLTLYRHLATRGLVRAYVGLEQSPAMLRLGTRRGVEVRPFDVRASTELPPAETVIMQASLYQFHDVAETLLPRLWATARRLLVIAEPVRNLAQSRNGGGAARPVRSLSHPGEPARADAPRPRAGRRLAQGSFTRSSTVRVEGGAASRATV